MAKHDTKDGLRSKRELVARMEALAIEAVKYRVTIAALNKELSAKNKRIRMLEHDLWALSSESDNGV